FKRKEVLFGTGATNFFGDLGGANQIGTNGIRDFDFKAIRPAFMIGYKYRTTKETAIKFNFTYARLSGSDKYTKEPYRNNRNCNFRTPVYELSTQFEYAIIRERPSHIYNLKGISGWKYLQITSYFFAGVGVMHFNPKGEWNGQWYALQPLHTEGQGLVPTRPNYSLFQLVIPFGVGFKYALSKEWSVGLEYGIRKTFTDYIDDVSTTYFDPDALYNNYGPTSVHFGNPTNGTLDANATGGGQQRGNVKNDDSYMFAIVSFYYKIPRGVFTLPKF
ncbi:MAG: hypothetical protein HGB12_16490, partial [Bacteroidetes bacterium]|nr:hypothetical protein [Bacteroidota bacterium]